MNKQLDAASSSPIFRIGVFALIFDDEGRILLGHRRDVDWWNLPGGGMEVGETVDEALCREVREETGLDVEVGQLVGVYSKPQKQEVVLASAAVLLAVRSSRPKRRARAATSHPVLCPPIRFPNTASVSKMPCSTRQARLYVPSAQARSRTRGSSPPIYRGEVLTKSLFAQ